MDYSKWDAMAADEDREEERRKIEQRNKNKEDYMREQQERVQKHQQQQQQQSATAAKTEHKHHDHQHSHDHQHEHSHSREQRTPPAGPAATEASLPAFRRTCGCGFTDIDTLLAMQKHAAANPGPSPEEKRQKQLDAVIAIRKHAKELYTAQHFQNAYTIYERGALIIAGMTDLPPALQQLISEHELAITHNMALCQFQLHNYAHAMQLSQTALQLTDDPDGPEAAKAYYRMLQCHVRLGHWDDAEAAVEQVQRRGGWKGLEEEQRLMRKMKEAEKVKEREFSLRMKERMQAQQDKERQRRCLDETKDGGVLLDTQ